MGPFLQLMGWCCLGGWCRYGGALGIDGNETLIAVNVIDSRFVNNLASIGGT